MSRHWYVHGVGLRCGEWCPGAIAISEHLYAYCKENYDLLHIVVDDGVVRATIDIVAYRKLALTRIANTDYIVVDNRKYFDDELPYMSADYITRSGYPCLLSQQQMIKKVTERNRQFALRRSGIQTATTPEEIDGFLT
mgnify:CR=1 FL=1